MTVYTMAHVEVTDADSYGKYAALAGPAVAKYGGEFLVRGGASEVIEGTAKSRHVIIKWADMETAKKFYYSPEYQEALSHAVGASERDYLFVEGA